MNTNKQAEDSNKVVIQKDITNKEQELEKFITRIEENLPIPIFNTNKEHDDFYRLVDERNKLLIKEARTQAISEFKEKLKEEIIYLLKCEEGIVEKFDKLLEKTAQEIKA